HTLLSLRRLFPGPEGPSCLSGPEPAGIRSFLCLSADSACAPRLRPLHRHALARPASARTTADLQMSPQPPIHGRGARRGRKEKEALSATSDRAVIPAPAALERWLPAGISLAFALLYLRTLCPTVYLGDSGEICTAIASGGITHPPGYPLFSLLG